MTDLGYTSNVMETFTVDYPLADAIEKIGNMEAAEWAVRQILTIGTHQDEYHVFVVFERNKP